MSVHSADSAVTVEFQEMRFPVLTAECPDCHRTMTPVAFWVAAISNEGVWQLACPVGHDSRALPTGRFI